MRKLKKKMLRKKLSKAMNQTKVMESKGYFKISTPHEVDPDKVKETLVNLRLKLGNELSVAEDFKWEYLFDSLLSKLARPGVSDSQRERAAVLKMLETEAVCAEFNRTGFTPSGFDFQSERFNTVMQRAKNIIRNTLGPFELSYFDRSAFSSGATTSRLKEHGDPYFKYNSCTEYLDVTSQAYPYARALIKCTPFWEKYGATLRVVLGNKIFTVPKKTEIDRCCAKEPDLNMALQRALGLTMRDKLKTIGIDLRDQTRNQRLAKEGSKTGDLATIDLSSASDSICYALVKELLPADWFSVLDDLRSPTGFTPDGEEHVWQKFSSMGNGYTFELESLIFYSLTQAVVDYEREEVSYRTSTVSVYGDDIICPSVVASSVIAVLSLCGFTTNKEKTFISGPFRESCGEHYYNGVNVTPFYVKKVIDTYQGVIWLCNHIRCWAYDHSLKICDDTLYPVWRDFSRLVPKCLKGGRNLESTTSLYSPGKVQMRLNAFTEDKTFRGGNAYLRFMQNHSQAASLGPFGPYTWLGRANARFLRVGFTDICQENPGKIDTSSNAFVSPTFFSFEESREQSHVQSHLFSKEIW